MALHAGPFWSLGMKMGGCVRGWRVGPALANRGAGDMLKEPISLRQRLWGVEGTPAPEYRTVSDVGHYSQEGVAQRSEATSAAQTRRLADDGFETGFCAAPASPVTRFP